MALPADFKGVGPFQVAHPADTLPRGPWWRLYGNPELDRLESELPANPDLKAAAESFTQARDIAAEVESGLYPQLGAGYAMSENRQSVNRLFRSSTNFPLEESLVSTDLAASWEIDIWDRIANAARARKRIAQSVAADVASLDLSLQAELAEDYLALRGLDGDAAVYRDTIGFYGKAVSITQLRLADKIGSALDVDRADTQLASAQAALLDVTARRAVLEHAIASLIDVPASAFSLPPQDRTPLSVPAIPTGVPSTLLQRRPDVAAAERDMQAANASIGVARAAFYPNVSLGATAGFVARSFDLVSLPNSMWQVGMSLAEPLFQGGLRTAVLQQARSAYAQTTDQYRATVLAADQDVEDQLASVRLLSEEAARDQEAVAASNKVQSLALQLYTAGADNYLSVVVAQVAALSSGVTQVDTETRAQQASVNLIRALGGGWDTTEIPPLKDIRPFNPLVPN
jgi:NodT family efflux transporter outer membrane factor (OMF) lipoprotein